MTIRVAINGFGRIGRSVLRALLDRRQGDLDVVAINDLADPHTAAHLTSFDSIYGPLSTPVEHDDRHLVFGDRVIRYLSEADPSLLPWNELGIDIALECTGTFTSRKDAAKHIEAGARRVLISGPSADADFTAVYGVNEQRLSASHQVVSAASCTTNCLAPLIRVLEDTSGIRAGFMTTIHSFTADQRLVDAPHKDLRRARAASQSAIPTSTGAAKALHLVIPEVKGKLDGAAIRVPTASVSMVDLAVQVDRATRAEELRSAFERASLGPMAGVLALEDRPLVSIDFRRRRESSVVDWGQTHAVGPHFIRLAAWYDNEWGFSNRMCDLAAVLGQNQ